MSRVIAIVAAILSLPVAAGAANVRGMVQVGGTAAADAVIYLEHVGGPLPGPPPAPVIMDQRNLRFAPGVLPVQQGTVVQFHNSDDVQHNVFTPSEAGGRFDLGTYNRGEERSVKLDQVGDLVILCNIHMEMEAHVLVLRDRSFAVADASGAYRIGDVAPGNYTLKLWKGRWLEHEQSVSVGETGDVVIDVSAAN
jgi:plastocyanin